MKEVSQVTACVVDTGLFLNFARTLAGTCDRVLYFNPETRSYPSLHQHAIGMGFPEIECVKEFWSEFKNIDLFCFPDIGCSALQEYLRSVGKPVWGAGKAEYLELNREKFLKRLEDVGLEVPQHHICEGLGELRDFLKEKEDHYVKISRWRGDMETHHFRNYAMDRTWLDVLAVQFGPLQDKVRFLVFPSIKAEIEIGGDTYSIDGDWPNTMLSGVEGKDKSYFAAVTPRSEMPEQVLHVMNAFGPIMMGYRQQWSSEIRVTADGTFYFIDPTCRGGMPSSGSQQLLWKNFADIVWHGANGILIEPEPVGLFSMETMITSKDDDKDWCACELPGELEGKVHFYRCALVDGVYSFPPSEYGHRDLGWLVSIADSPAAVLKRQKDAADLLPDGFNADVESMASVIQDIQKASKDGIQFTEQPLPEPAEVL